MNCSSCQNQLEEYISGNLTEKDSTSLKIHLDSCSGCYSMYASMLLTEKVIAKEKESYPNPFLATRIMASVENNIQKEHSRALGNLKIFWQTTSVAVSVIVAITIGVLAGNQFISSVMGNEIPEELVYLNDASMESLNLFVNE